MNQTSYTFFERWLEENPDMESEAYRLYVSRGGKRWGYYYRMHYEAEFKKRYKNFWLKRPDLWPCDNEL
jgi:hypothetical protein